MLPKIKKYIRRLSLYEAKFAKTKEEKNKIKRLILKSLTSKTRFIKTKIIKETKVITGVKPTVLTLRISRSIPTIKTRISVFKSGKSMNDKIETIKRKGRAKIAVSKNNDARINKTKINLKFIRRIKV